MPCPLQRVLLGTSVVRCSSSRLQLTTAAAAAAAVCLRAEGIAIGVPVFFATGSRWKAIGWAAVSGIAEPLGALIGFALWQSGNLNLMAMGM